MKTSGNIRKKWKISLRPFFLSKNKYERIERNKTIPWLFVKRAKKVEINNILKEDIRALIKAINARQR